jgi:hypothetical protein
MKLLVDEKLVPMNDFVQGIFRRVVLGMLDSLEDIPEKKESVTLSLRRSAQIYLTVDGNQVRMNAFVQRIIGNVFLGMVACLEDVPDEPIELSLSL